MTGRSGLVFPETPEQRPRSEEELLDHLEKKLYPTWEGFPVVKHGRNDTLFSGMYCLASCVCWFRRFDDKPPAIRPVLGAQQPPLLWLRGRLHWAGLLFTGIGAVVRGSS
jgi:hypothetical protein